MPPTAVWMAVLIPCEAVRFASKCVCLFVFVFYKLDNFVHLYGDLYGAREV